MADEVAGLVDKFGMKADGSQTEDELRGACEGCRKVAKR